MRFCFFSWFFKNCDLIKDSSWWHSNFIPLVHDSVIIIGSGSVTYTFGSHFIYKCWVRVSTKIRVLALLGKYSNIICWVSKRIDLGSHHLYMQFIIKLHGMPVSMVSDKKATFTSLFWTELFRLQGTYLVMSTAYHPQIDGQTNIVNKSLDQYLRAFTNDRSH